MKYRDHINLAVTLGTGAILAGAVNPPVIPKLPPEMSLFLVLFGAGMVDIDVNFTRGKPTRNNPNGNPGSGHRVRSKMHWLESPIIFMLVGNVLWSIGSRISGAILFWFSTGWLLHLIGDFLQGGIMCRVLNKRVGFKRFTWTLYNDTGLGTAVHFLLGLSAFGALMAFMWLFCLYPDRFLSGIPLPGFLTGGLYRRVLAGMSLTTPLYYAGVHLFFVVASSWSSCIARSVVGIAMFSYFVFH